MGSGSGSVRCIHVRAVVVASGAMVRNGDGLQRDCTLRWCSCGALRCNDGAWLEPRSDDARRRCNELAIEQRTSRGEPPDAA